jgi:hypothetical protein
MEALMHEKSMDVLMDFKIPVFTCNRRATILLAASLIMKVVQKYWFDGISKI